MKVAWCVPLVEKGRVRGPLDTYLPGPVFASPPPPRIQANAISSYSPSPFRPGEEAIAPHRCPKANPLPFANSQLLLFSVETQQQLGKESKEMAEATLGLDFLEGFDDFADDLTNGYPHPGGVDVSSSLLFFRVFPKHANFVILPLDLESCNSFVHYRFRHDSFCWGPE